MKNNNLFCLSKEEESLGSLPLWAMWKCPVCLRSIMSASKPAPMYWENDHQCDFLKLDEHGNMESDALFELEEIMKKVLKNFKKDLTDGTSECIL